MNTAVVCILAAVPAAANDPSDSWLSYVVWKAPNPDTDVITRMSAKTVVQGIPKRGGSFTAIWFGTQTKHGDGALLQPILPALQRVEQPGWSIFSEVFDWTDQSNHNSEVAIAVAPGDVVVGEIELINNATRTYKVSAHLDKPNAQVASKTYSLLPGQKDPESAAYFVIEHGVEYCDQLPSSGGAPFYDIQLELNGEPVKDIVAQFSKSIAQTQSGCPTKWVTDASTGYINVTWGK